MFVTQEGGTQNISIESIWSDVQTRVGISNKILRCLRTTVGGTQPHRVSFSGFGKGGEPNIFGLNIQLHFLCSFVSIVTENIWVKK